MKKAKEFWTEVTTCKISKSQAKKFYEESIEKEMNALKDEKSNNIKKYNILNILENVGSIFTAETYLRYKELPKETMFERSIAERLKLRKKTGKIERKEKYEKIKNELFKAYFTIN